MSVETPAEPTSVVRPSANSIARAVGVVSPLNWPELNVFVFGILINLPWEFLQAPLFRGMANLSHIEGARLCLAASVGDGALLLVAYCATSWTLRSRRWAASHRWPDVALFTGIGWALSVIVEGLSIGLLDRWSYGDAMVVIPMVGIGLAPFFQWLLLPPIVAFVVHRQVCGPAEARQHMKGAVP